MKKIVIIGGGVAGLSAGIYARLQGFQAVICEQNVTVGGNLMGWQRGKYHIDNCIHWLTGTNPNTPTYTTWKQLGALDDNTPIYQGNTLYTVEYKNQRLSLHKDLSTLQAEMIKICPADKREIDKLITAVHTIQAFQGIDGKTHDVGASFQNIWKMPTLIRYTRMSTEELAKRFTHPLLQAFIVYFLGKTFSSLAFLFVLATFCGANGGIPKGGSLQMAKRMKNRFLELGGTLLTKKQAKRINIRGKKATSVSFTDGTNIRADYIVCTADARHTFDELLRLPMPNNLENCYKNMQRFSAVQVAFACNSDNLPFSADFIFPLDEKLQKLLRSPYLILREFSHEPSFAPKGKTIMQAMVFVNEPTAREWISLYENKTKYAEKKDEFAKMVESVIVKKFPRYKADLQLLDVWTPATYKRYTQAEIGSFMSFILPKNKLPLPISSKVRGLQNVFLATQWQQSPGGLPTAAEMGKRAVKAIVYQEQRKPLPFSLPFFKGKKQKA